jgi:hypothetical protein
LPLYAAIEVKRFADGDRHMMCRASMRSPIKNETMMRVYHEGVEHISARSNGSMRFDDFRGIDSSKYLNESTMMHNLMD